MIKPIAKETLIDRGALFATTVTEGFQQYHSVILKAKTFQAWYDFLVQVWGFNENAAFGDFYYATLSGEEKSRFKSGLDNKEQACLSSFELDNTKLYYPITETELEFLLGITVREWLFSTFYFTNKKVTIWGNYKMEFPVFCEDKDTLDYYLVIAKKCGLEC